MTSNLAPMTQVQYLEFTFNLKTCLRGKLFLLLKNKIETQKFPGIKERQEKTKARKGRSRKKQEMLWKRQTKVGFFGSPGLKGRKKEVRDGPAGTGIN